MNEPSPGMPASQPTPVQLTPDLLDWARQQVSEEEHVAGIRDVRENGGVPFESIIQRLKSGL